MFGILLFLIILLNLQLSDADRVANEKEYSKIDWFTTPSGADEWGIFYNVCYRRADIDRIRGIMIFFQDDNHPLNTDISFSDHLEFIVMKIPFAYTNYHNETGNWLLIQYISWHIGHFLDNHAFLINILKNPSHYPELKVIYNPTFDSKTEIEYNKILLDNFLSKFNPPIIYKKWEDVNKEMNLKSIICFKQLNIVGYNRIISFGGMFLSIESKLSFRDSILNKYKNQYIQSDLSKTIIIAVIRRNVSEHRIRNALNYKMIFKMLKELEKKSNLYNIKVYRIEFEHLTFKSQIILSNQIDIYISPHGTSIINHLWLMSKSVVIEMFPYMFVQWDWEIHSTISNLIYIPLLSTRPQPGYKSNHIHSELCNLTTNTLKHRINVKRSSQWCRYWFVESSFYANMKLIMSTVNYGIRNVIYWKKINIFK